MEVVAGEESAFGSCSRQVSIVNPSRKAVIATSRDAAFEEDRRSNVNDLYGDGSSSMDGDGHRPPSSSAGNGAGDVWWLCGGKVWG
ncbi:hypothetical protein TIFTF001_016800 [Ficus carica]|uniref:Uncharacterized protein n=1 Tax=Ficus carica TaxID=3494 RepID=A0AA88A8E3_FICCA|nr:hypothetical protein TIFTF001_016800 [Ficus carica]